MSTYTELRNRHGLIFSYVFIQTVNVRWLHLRTALFMKKILNKENRKKNDNRTTFAQTFRWLSFYTPTFRRGCVLCRDVLAQSLNAKTVLRLEMWRQTISCTVREFLLWWNDLGRLFHDSVCNAFLDVWSQQHKGISLEVFSQENHSIKINLLFKCLLVSCYRLSVRWNFDENSRCDFVCSHEWFIYFVKFIFILAVNGGYSRESLSLSCHSFYIIK